MIINLNKGQSVLNLDIEDEKIIDILIGKDTPALGHDKVGRIIEQGILNHTPGRISEQKIVVIIPDNTRLWARGDLFVPRIIKSLIQRGAEKRNITIIVALGTHADLEPDAFTELAGAFCAKNINIVNSANQNRNRLKFIGTTRKKTDLYITREAAQADHIIIFGGVLHHMLAGFGGGRKYILPGIAGYDSIQQNHSLAIKKDGTAHPLVRQAKLRGNPVSEDLDDAARMFLTDKTSSYVTVAANGIGDIFHAAVGELDQTFIKACEKLDQACCVPVAQKADFAIISTGGHRTDTQLYQSTKALFNVVNSVKDGGNILFVAGCSQGIGNQTFGDTLKQYRQTPEQLGKKLCHTFNMPAYVAFRVMDILDRFNVTLCSDLDKSTTIGLGFSYADDLDLYINQLHGKGFVIPFAENILPVVNQT